MAELEPPSGETNDACPACKGNKSLLCRMRVAHVIYDSDLFDENINSKRDLESTCPRCQNKRIRMCPVCRGTGKRTTQTTFEAFRDEVRALLRDHSGVDVPADICDLLSTFVVKACESCRGVGCTPVRVWSETKDTRCRICCHLVSLPHFPDKPATSLVDKHKRGFVTFRNPVDCWRLGHHRTCLECKGSGCHP